VHLGDSLTISYSSILRQLIAADGFIAAGDVQSNFLCNLGYGDVTKLHPRGPRLGFNEACQLL
jgi:hypothetical protein